LRERGVAEDALNALSHLLGGFIGECYSQNTVRADSAFLNEIGDAVRDDAGFAGTGAGEQEHRPIDREDSLALLRIHVGEEVRHLSILDAMVVGAPGQDS
jgi:hypothetical protein